MWARVASLPQRGEKLMEMIDQRIVHVTGSTIEPYDVRIGEGVMGQLAQVLGKQACQSGAYPHPAGAASFGPCAYFVAPGGL